MGNFKLDEIRKKRILFLVNLVVVKNMLMFEFGVMVLDGWLILFKEDYDEFID